MHLVLPRVVIAGLSGDSGKTLVSLGVVRALTARGVRVASYKKGPDFIDAAWLGAAAYGAGRNLDTFLMSEQIILNSVASAKKKSELVLIEGNRGLFDGLDAQGTHSTAELAKLLHAPVVLVVDVTKTTRTIAAQVLGCMKMDPKLNLVGVILNRVGTQRQEQIIRQAISDTTGLLILGAIPRQAESLLVSRHLGLVTSVEHPLALEVLEQLADLANQFLDLDQILALAHKAPTLELTPIEPSSRVLGQQVTIGVLRDEAFSFYYPENLEALESAGAELVMVSPLRDQTLPNLDALYIGGGFPEVYVTALSRNQEFKNNLAEAIAAGLPVYAECGGLMYLSQTLSKSGRKYSMVGALAVDCEHTTVPQGHGYVELTVDQPNPFFGTKTKLRGHEFHYSRLTTKHSELATAFSLSKGHGVGGGRDGLCQGNVLAAYTHIHASSLPEWALGLVAAAREYRHRGSGSDSRRPTGLSPERLANLQKTQSRNGESAGHSKPVIGPKSKAGISKGLRQKVEQLVFEQNDQALERLVDQEKRAVRFLVGLTYHPDAKVREKAGLGIALAGRAHPEMVQGVVRRLIWAMNDESGTNALTAPMVLLAISKVCPELLLPMVPDLLRLAKDVGLREGLSSTLKNLVVACPGKIGKSLGKSLSEITEGGCCAGCAS